MLTQGSYKKNVSNTTLDPIELSIHLKKIKKKKIENVILEASSHGLKQHRLDWFRVYYRNFY